ncbi:hypothetical protein WJX72_012129 [[Myrmecia] bisecta]|uniref:Ammonium transporter n=1 Tax=[Myrmecia] bisecta TaxID=41462 RepID=A0AAW1PPH7_9CHLO
MLLTGALVFFMQCGFALLESGSIRFKNTRNILLKNVVNTCLSGLVWWGIGQAFAQGGCAKHANAFIGTQYFFASDSSDNSLFFVRWFFGWVFCAVSVTLVSGALAERCQLRAYLLYTIWQTGITYPAVASWVWGLQGWLSPFRINCATGLSDILLSKTAGLIDYAGSANVHMTGGGAALVGCILLGPRIGRFAADGTVIEILGNNSAHQVLGTLILWLGWYGFNAGSTECVYGCMYTASKIAVNTSLAAAAGGVTSLVVTAALGHPGDVRPALNGILAGLVGITSGCSVVEPYAAVIIGGTAAVAYVYSAILLRKLRIDDPLDSVAVHFFGGIVGVLAPGFFATKANMILAYNLKGPPADWGVFYGGKGYQLGMQLLGALAVASWTLFMNGLLFGMLRALGWLRVSEKKEVEGLDHSQSIGTGVVGVLPCLFDSK